MFLRVLVLHLIIIFTPKENNHFLTIYTSLFCNYVYIFFATHITITTQLFGARNLRNTNSSDCTALLIKMTIKHGNENRKKLLMVSSYIQTKRDKHEENN